MRRSRGSLPLRTQLASSYDPFNCLSERTKLPFKFQIVTSTISSIFLQSFNIFSPLFLQKTALELFFALVCHFQRQRLPDIGFFYFEVRASTTASVSLPPPPFLILISALDRACPVRYIGMQVFLAASSDLDFQFGPRQPNPHVSRQPDPCLMSGLDSF